MESQNSHSEDSNSKMFLFIQQTMQAVSEYKEEIKLLSTQMKQLAMENHSLKNEVKLLATPELSKELPTLRKFSRVILRSRRKI